MYDGVSHLCLYCCMFYNVQFCLLYRVVLSKVVPSFLVSDGF